MTSSTRKRQKKVERKTRKRRQKLQRRADLGPPIGEFGPLVVLRPQRLRMSEVISHLARPILDEHVETSDDLEHIISLTIAAWNIAVQPADRQEEEFARAAKKLFRRDPEGQAFFRWVCDVVAERRKRFYPHVSHFITNVRFEREDDGDVYFEVMYAMESGNARD